MLQSATHTHTYTHYIGIYCSVSNKTIRAGGCHSKVSPFSSTFMRQIKKFLCNNFIDKLSKKAAREQQGQQQAARMEGTTFKIGTRKREENQATKQTGRTWAERAAKVFKKYKNCFSK